jgi:hypothetical protein
MEGESRSWLIKLSMSSKVKFVLSKQEAKALYELTERDFLQIGPPDLVQSRSPHGVKYIYRIERLEAWVAAHQAELAGLSEHRAKRRHAAQAAVQTRRTETIRWAGEVVLELYDLPHDLNRQVCVYYRASRIDVEQLVDFVCWRFSNYPFLLKGLAGRTGGREARHILKERIDEIIRVALNKPRG